ncbi:MAG: alpha/beta fold hydrolase [bacterium]
MIIEIDGLDLWYEVLGKGEPVLVLHGWGGDIDSVRPLIEQLGGKFQAYGLDLPGFGRSGLPDKPWGTHDYQRLVSRFISRLDLAPVYIIGHSFGGRIGICLGAEEPQLIKKLVLVDSAGIKPKRTLAYYLKVYAYKLGKTLLKPWGSLGGRGLKRWHKLFGSQDYRQSGALRKTLVKVVNEDLRDLLPKINPPPC